MNLEELAVKHGTDKKFSNGHGYTVCYEKYFEKIRNEKLNVLELGVREGWSLKMWTEYFPNSNIFGIDNNAENLCPKSFVNPNITFKLYSQTDRESLLSLATSAGGFDIIIDDASHISSLSIESFEILFPTLREKGIYVIEDMHVCHIGIYNPKNYTTHQYIDDVLKKRSDINIAEYLNRKICFIQKL